MVVDARNTTFINGDELSIVTPGTAVFVTATYERSLPILPWNPLGATKKDQADTIDELTKQGFGVVAGRASIERNLDDSQAIGRFSLRIVEVPEDIAPEQLQAGAFAFKLIAGVFILAVSAFIFNLSRAAANVEIQLAKTERSVANASARKTFSIFGIAAVVAIATVVFSKRRGAANGTVA